MIKICGYFLTVMTEFTGDFDEKKDHVRIHSHGGRIR